ncbi:hypothetical protein BDY24DRAFT_383084 [Mrakia frigida]|uniref:uncharacterized protein n=1 Tax=Mrakia frigida TaxID=29902 RepID=UPI003FCC148E
MSSRPNPFDLVPPAPSQEEEAVGHPLPPSTLPSSSSSLLEVALPPPVWPFSDPNIRLYFDPISIKAQSLQKTLERKAAASGASSSNFSTTDINQASHIILDPNVKNETLASRTQPLPRRVSYQWVVDSFLEEEALPEEDYGLSLPDIRSSSSEVVKAGERARHGGKVRLWLPEEEKEMARFLASDPQDDGTGYLSIWNQHQKMHPFRSADAYYIHYRSQRSIIDKLARSFQAVEEGSAAVEFQEESNGALSPPSDNLTNRVRPGTWSNEEKEELARFLASDPSLSHYGPPIWNEYHRRHPSRKATSYRTYYNFKRRFFDARISQLKASSNGQGIVCEHPESAEVEEEDEKDRGERSGSSSLSELGDSSDSDTSELGSDTLSSNLASCSTSRPPPGMAWSSKESEDLVSLMARMDGSRTIDIARAFVKSYPIRTSEGVIAHRRRYRTHYGDAIQPPRPHDASTTTPVPGKRSTWSREMARDLCKMFSSQGERSNLDVFREFIQKYPEMSVNQCKAYYRRKKFRIHFEIEALRRGEGTQEEEEEESLGDDKELDEEIQPLDPVRISSSSCRRKSSPPSQSGSSKRRRISLPSQPLNAVASSSTSHRLSLPSSRPAKPAPKPHSPPTSSQQQPSALEPTLPLPKPFTNAVASSSHPSPTSHRSPPLSSSSSSSSRLPSGSTLDILISNLPPPTPPPPNQSSSSTLPAPRPPPPAQPQIEPSSSDDEGLEPLSFLVLGSKPSTCSSTSPFCYLCGEDDSPTYNSLHLVEKDRTRREEVVCDVCEARTSKTMAKAERLGMEGDKKMIWVTEVLVEKGLKQRREWVFGKEGRRGE